MTIDTKDRQIIRALEVFGVGTPRLADTCHSVVRDAPHQQQGPRGGGTGRPSGAL